MDVKDTRLQKLRQIIADRFNGIAGKCADYLGIKHPQISRWVTENKKSRQGISEESARAIEHGLGLPHGWMDSTDDLLPTFNASFRYDVFPIKLANDGVVYIPFRKGWIRSNGYTPDRLLGVDVIGDSMVPSLFAGDLVIVNTEDQEPQNGEVFAVSIHGDPIVMKRFRRESGEWWLYSDGPMQVQYPKKFDNEVKVVGRAVFRQTERV